jgi:hypothetical protein
MGNVVVVFEIELKPVPNLAFFWFISSMNQSKGKANATLFLVLFPH